MEEELSKLQTEFQITKKKEEDAYKFYYDETAEVLRLKTKIELLEKKIKKQNHERLQTIKREQWSEILNDPNLWQDLWHSYCEYPLEKESRFYDEEYHRFRFLKEKELRAIIEFAVENKMEYYDENMEDAEWELNTTDWDIDKIIEFQTKWDELKSNIYYCPGTQIGIGNTRNYCLYFFRSYYCSKKDNQDTINSTKWGGKYYSK